MRFLQICLLALTFSICAGCAPASEPEAPAGPNDTDTGETSDAPADPDADAGSVWSYLEESDYQGWAAWPGKDTMFEGQEPHGALLSVYLNPAALDALERSAGIMPDGAIIVKDNYSPERELVATTVMYKSEGFAPAHNDWFWMKRLADGTVEAAGEVEGCQQCHGTAADNDYVLTGPIGR